MTDQPTTPNIKGYTSVNDDKRANVNINKVFEETLLRRIEALKSNQEYDQRALSIAFTNIQDAFMWLNRAIFKPERIALPEDTMGNNE